MFKAWCAVALAIASFVLFAQEDQAQPNKACRSVHLWYAGAEGVEFYNEAIVEQSSPGTYFCACGFSKGYFGIQQLTNGKKLVIFSVWDPGNQNDPRKVVADRRVKVLKQGDGVRVGRFGNEGTGGQSFLDYDWKIGQTCRFLVTAAPDGPDRTACAAYFYIAEKKTWQHMATFSTISGGHLLRGYYSFVEDFLRNGESATKARKAYYAHGWVKTKDAAWEPLVKATFTGDNSPAMNIDAGSDGEKLFLITGGKTENQTTKLKDVIQCKPNSPPSNLPK